MIFDLLCLTFSVFSAFHLYKNQDFPDEVSEMKAIGNFLLDTWSM